MLARRSLDDRQELAYYIVHAKHAQARLKRLVQVAGRHREIEIGFKATKGECGLDQYEVRRWQGWYRHITLALLAYAVLVALRGYRRKKHTPGLIALSVPELRKLLSHLLWHTSQAVEHVLHWSVWRRKHQYRARQAHYQRRQCSPPE